MTDVISYTQSYEGRWFARFQGKEYPIGHGATKAEAYQNLPKPVPARKRVEGWVNVYCDETRFRTVHDTKEAADDQRVGPRKTCVLVREIDPAAEKEARELRDKWNRPPCAILEEGSAVACIIELKRALSLLLHDEARS